MSSCHVAIVTFGSTVLSITPPHRCVTCSPRTRSNDCSFVTDVGGVRQFSCAIARLGVGGWQPIKDLNDSHVKGIAEFAVAEINKQSETNLKLESIVKGEQQVV
ncbi:hypothetical protein SLEP1_g55797 [Rubroshorea leprosula]|uniref:Cystatin domain-containing protein n=1 Tax=Rubroshorea leprosula TaxID=152421 RepID=A0AAV5MJJ1_9ROSI|nr:hypothetical protein SLEP1_g55797 [Rubroshorea leprosula]